MDIISRIVTPPQQISFANKGSVLLGTSGTGLYRIENKASSVLAKTAEEKVDQLISYIRVLVEEVQRLQLKVEEEKK